MTATWRGVSPAASSLFIRAGSCSIALFTSAISRSCSFDRLSHPASMRVATVRTELAIDLQMERRHVRRTSFFASSCLRGGLGPALPQRREDAKNRQVFGRGWADPCSSVVAFILLVRPVLGADLFVGDGHQVALRANQQDALRNGRRRHANFTHAVLRQELILRPRL